MIQFKNKLKDARKDAKLTQQQLADELNKLGHKVSNTAVANWESGLNKPDIDTLDSICIILNKDGNYFFEKVSDKTTSNIDLDGLTEEELEELERFKEFLKDKKNNPKKD